MTKVGNGRPRYRSLQKFAQRKQDEYALGLIEAYEEELDAPMLHELMQWVINFPMTQARFRNMPTAIMIDEFQVLTNVYNPQNQLNYDLTDSFQRACETKWAPLFVSGSSISLLVGQALGGFLSGRFRALLRPQGSTLRHAINPTEQRDGCQLMRKKQKS